MDISQKIITMLHLSGLRLKGKRLMNENLTNVTKPELASGKAIPLEMLVIILAVDNGTIFY